MQGSQPAFAPGDVVDVTDATDIRSITERHSLSPSSVVRTAMGASCDALSPCSIRRQCCLPMTEYAEASVLTARRAAQHLRLSDRDDAYEHLCILALLPSLGPLHPMLADTPWPHGFGATLASVGTLSEGFERSVASPLQPRRLRATGRTV